MSRLSKIHLNLMEISLAITSVVIGLMGIFTFILLPVVHDTTKFKILGKINVVLAFIFFLLLPVNAILLKSQKIVNWHIYCNERCFSKWYHKCLFVSLLLVGCIEFIYFYYDIKDNTHNEEIISLFSTIYYKILVVIMAVVGCAVYEVAKMLFISLENSQDILCTETDAVTIKLITFQNISLTDILLILTALLITSACSIVPFYFNKELFDNNNLGSEFDCKIVSMILIGIFIIELLLSCLIALLCFNQRVRNLHIFCNGNCLAKDLQVYLFIVLNAVAVIEVIWVLKRLNDYGDSCLYTKFQEQITYVCDDLTGLVLGLFGSLIYDIIKYLSKADKRIVYCFREPIVGEGRLLRQERLCSV